MIIDTQKKSLVYLLAGILTLVVLWQLIIVPLIKYQKKLDQSIAINTMRLKKLLILENQLKRLASTKKTFSKLTQKTLPITLFSYLEQLASKNSLKEKIDFLRPSSKNLSDNVVLKMVDLRLKAISLSKLMPFLASIESSQYGISIDRLTIKAEEGNGLLDVDLTCSILRNN